MISAASTPASRAAAVSSRVSSSLADPVPGTNGTRSATAVGDRADGGGPLRDASARSAPRSSRRSRCRASRMPAASSRGSSRLAWSSAPSAVNGVITAAMEPRIWLGSLRNLIRMTAFLALRLGNVFASVGSSGVVALRERDDRIISEPSCLLRRNASSVARRWFRAASSIVIGSACVSISLRSSACSATDSWARPGTKLNVDSRSALSRPQPRCTRSSTCGFGQCSNSTA